MNDQSNRLYPPMGVGILTVLMVFVVVLLTSFAAMSLLSANADANLTDKACQSVAAYYEADAKAERMVCDIASALTTNSWRSALEFLGVSVWANGNEAEISFSVPINKDNRLFVRLDQPLSLGFPAGDFMRTTWQMQTQTDTN